MLNYIWAGLIIFSLVFALVSDVRDLTTDAYRNQQQLPVTLRFPEGYNPDARRVDVAVSIDPATFQQFYGTPESRFVDLPPGIRRDRSMPADYLQQRLALRRQLGLPEDGRLFLFVGSGFRTKGLDRAVTTAARVMKANDQFHVVGADRAGPYQRLAAKLGVGP